MRLDGVSAAGCPAQSLSVVPIVSRTGVRTLTPAAVLVEGRVETISEVAAFVGFIAKDNCVIDLASSVSGAVTCLDTLCQ
jgi:hypothetical protein